MTSPKSSRNAHAKPHVNVTPLIDVLLVLLIIFMVISPMKPGRFLTSVPSEPDKTPVEPPPLGLVVTIKSDRTLMLNHEEMGSIYDTDRLSLALSDVFEKRFQNHAYSYSLRDRIDLPESARIERTVFIKAPRSLPYGEVARVIDGIKGAGATPIGLQIDDLD